MLCQRCGRTICPECQIPAAVGVHCPDCVREARSEYRAQRASSGPRTPAFIRRLQGSAANGVPIVTYAIMALCVIVWVFEFVPVVGQYIDLYGVYRPVLTERLPWTMVTALFVHSTGSLLHLPLNMLSLFFIGPALESMLGRARYLALYLIAGFAGSVAVLLLAPSGGVLGASGAIFGLLGAYFVIARRLGGNATQILVVVALNLVLGFVIPGVSWQAHIGGVVVGALVGLVFVTTRARRRRTLQVAAIAGIVLVLVAVTAVGVTNVAQL